MAPSQPQGSSGPREWPQDGVTAGWASSPQAGEQGEIGTGRKRGGLPGVWWGSPCSWQQEPWVGRARHTPNPFLRHLPES